MTRSILTALLALCPALLWAQDATPAPGASPAPLEAEASPTPGETAGAKERAAVRQASDEASQGIAAAQARVAEAQGKLADVQTLRAQADKALAAAIAEVKSQQAALTAAEAAVKGARAKLEQLTEKAAEAAKGAEGKEPDATEQVVAKKAQEAQEASAAQLKASEEALAQAKAGLAAKEELVEAASKTLATRKQAVQEATSALAKAREGLEAAQASVAAAAAAERAMERVKNTPRGPEMPLDELKLRLKPLTKEELEAEAEAWLQVLKAKATGITYATIAAKDAQEAERAVILDALNELRDERTATIDLLDAVLTALEAKGGDPKPYLKYKAAVTGIAIDTGDVSATYAAVKGWLLSPQGGIRWVLNLIKFIVTLIVFKVIGFVVGKVLEQALRSRRLRTSELLKDFFVNVTRKAISFLGIVMALSMLEISVAPFLAAMGGGALVIGLALQGTLSNFASGVMILMYRPYDIGDFVQVAGVNGTVTAMSLVSTTLMTPDNQMVVVPNASIWGGIITNVTGSTRRRIDLVFGIGYDDDMAQAEALMREVVTAHPAVLSDPAPVIKVSELGDSSVNFICRPWVKTADYWDTKWDLTRQVKERFDAEGVSIPFPQRDVHFYPASPAAAEVASAASASPLSGPSLDGPQDVAAAEARGEEGEDGVGVDDEDGGEGGERG